MKLKEGTPVYPGYSEVTNADYKAVDREKFFKNIFEHANTSRKQVCQVRDIVARLNDKWSMLTIYALGGYGTLRFNEIKTKIGDISQRMLTVTLRNLEADGLIKRKVYAEIPPRVEYKLTPLGIELMEQYIQLANWAMRNSSRISRRRNR